MYVDTITYNSTFIRMKSSREFSWNSKSQLQLQSFPNSEMICEKICGREVVLFLDFISYFTKSFTLWLVFNEREYLYWTVDKRYYNSYCSHHVNMIISKQGQLYNLEAQCKIEIWAPRSKNLRILRWLQQNLTPSMGPFSLQGPVELRRPQAHEQCYNLSYP